MADERNDPREATPAKAEKPITYYCRTCGKSAGTAYVLNCPNCNAFRTLSAGKVSTQWVGGGGRPLLIEEIAEDDFERIATGTRELDRVLGGGIVTGSAVLLSGDPGIGKSTILLQVAIDLSVARMVEDEGGVEKEAPALTILYVSAEETSPQVKARALRLASQSKKLFILNESDVGEIERHVDALKVDILIIDSIQTMLKAGVEGGAGSVAQVRESAIALVALARSRGLGLIMVAHVNKEGVVAGPKTLEHLVDCVLEFHKEGNGDLRSIRASKNRFGDATEMGIFLMTKIGLRSVENPTDLLGARAAGRAGAAIALATLGPRPVAVELQTLVSAEGKGRLVTGMSSGRANQVIAVLGKLYGIRFGEAFVNVPGGFDEITDPGMDLPLALALASSATGKALPASFAAYGEVGLTGEIRPSSHADGRIKGAGMMGFEILMGPRPSEFERELVEAAKAHGSSTASKSQASGQNARRADYWEVGSLEEAFMLLGIEVTRATIATSTPT